jgi:hypothetical protein
MCKILKYRHSCGHNVLCLLSRCRGTYQKGNKIECSMVAACRTSEYLCLTSPTWCGPCRYQQWNAEWDSRLRRARELHAFVRDQVCLGEGEESLSLPERSPFKPASLQKLEKLVEDLENEHSSASWSIRRKFPMLPREHYERSKCNPRVSACSPLREEVHSEDIQDPTEQVEDDDYFKEKPFNTFQPFFMDRYGYVGPSIDKTTQNDDLNANTEEDAANEEEEYEAEPPERSWDEDDTPPAEAEESPPSREDTPGHSAVLLARRPKSTTRARNSLSLSIGGPDNENHLSNDTRTLLDQPTALPSPPPPPQPSLPPARPPLSRHDSFLDPPTPSSPAKVSANPSSAEPRPLPATPPPNTPAHPPLDAFPEALPPVPTPASYALKYAVSPATYLSNQRDAAVLMEKRCPWGRSVALPVAWREKEVRR